MSKLLYNVLKISWGQMPQMPPPGCAPGSDDAKLQILLTT